MLAKPSKKNDLHTPRAPNERRPSRKTARAIGLQNTISPSRCESENQPRSTASLRRGRPRDLLTTGRIPSELCCALANRDSTTPRLTIQSSMSLRRKRRIRPILTGFGNPCGDGFLRYAQLATVAGLKVISRATSLKSKRRESMFRHIA